MSVFTTLKGTVRQSAPPGVMGLLRRVSRRVDRVTLLKNLLLDHISDARRFFRWSHTGKSDPHRRQLESSIIKSYHGFEKALSLQAPRAGFGQDKARVLMRKIDEWNRLYPPSDMIEAARNTLVQYAEFNRSNDLDLPWLSAWLDRTAQEGRPIGRGGTFTRTRAEIEAAVASTNEDFFFSRHSLRNFAPGEVPMSDIEEAVRIAQRSPSVCNRQGLGVYCCPDAMDALKWQPGNGGFGHLASRGLVVVADLQAFSSEGERHQAFVDGGLFAMSLVYGLHSLGHGSCMLAWNKRPAEEAGLRKALKIPDNEVIIMMIAVGRLPEEFEVACSQRRPMSEILKVR